MMTSYENSPSDEPLLGIFLETIKGLVHTIIIYNEDKMVVNWEEIAPIPLPFNTHCFPACDTLTLCRPHRVCAVPNHYI
jgi:hypothetical protein